MSAPATAEGRTLVAVDTLMAGRMRVVVELDDGRLTLVQRLRSEGPAGEAAVKPMFVPVRIERLLALAENVIAGDDRAINHPKALLMLATGLVALLHVISDGKGDDADE